MSGGEPFFVDTNVLLYAAGTAHPEKNAAAREWMNVLWLRGLGRLSYQVLNEFYVNATRKTGVAVPLARETVLNLIAWDPLDTSAEMVQRAWHWTDAAQVTYWDALIIAAAELSNCRFLLTEDLQHDRTYGGVTVVNPFRTSPAALYPSE